MKIFLCHLDNGLCKPALQRTPFPHSWLCRLWFTSKWWETHPSPRMGWFGFQAVLLQDQEGSSVLPHLFPGNRSALLSLTGITQGVWGSWKTPRVVSHLAPQCVKPKVLPEFTQLLQIPWNVSSLSPPQKTATCTWIPLCCLLCLPWAPQPPERDFKRYKRQQVWEITGLTLQGNDLLMRRA